jgi:hypothetical protein
MLVYQNPKFLHDPPASSLVLDYPLIPEMSPNSCDTTSERITLSVYETGNERTSVKIKISPKRVRQIVIIAMLAAWMISQALAMLGNRHCRDVGQSDMLARMYNSILPAYGLNYSGNTYSLLCRSVYVIYGVLRVIIFISLFDVRVIIELIT